MHTKFAAAPRAPFSPNQPGMFYHSPWDTPTNTDAATPASVRDPLYALRERISPFPAPVGDVNSNVRGSGARYNAQKPDLSLIPAQIIDNFNRWADARPTYAPPLSAIQANSAGSPLQFLGHFQMNGSTKSLHEALYCLDTTRSGSVWADAARVFEYGRKKYAAWNWAKGQPWSCPIASAMRHIVFGLLQGEELDPESGLPHRGHVACNIIMLLWFVDHYPEGDDRYKPPVEEAQ